MNRYPKPREPSIDVALFFGGAMLGWLLVWFVLLVVLAK